jgi:hypothetical protein
MKVDPASIFRGGALLATPRQGKIRPPIGGEDGVTDLEIEAGRALQIGALREQPALRRTRSIGRIKA